MTAEKTKAVTGKINISNNVSIKKVVESKFGLDSKKKALKFSFVYTSKYEPSIGLIELEGDTVYLFDETTAKKVLNDWKKTKKVPTDVMRNLMGHVLAKSNVQAVVLSRDIQLPPPIPMPKIK
ncbi:MAG: hypothetical protein ABIB43_02230, partial [archaeon]